MVTVAGIGRLRDADKDMSACTNLFTRRSLRMIALRIIVLSAAALSLVACGGYPFG